MVYTNHFHIFSKPKPGGGVIYGVPKEVRHANHTIQVLHQALRAPATIDESIHKNRYTCDPDAEEHDPERGNIK